MGDEPGGDARELTERHQEHERVRRRRQARPVGRGPFAARVAGDDGERRGDAAPGQGNAGRRRRRHRRRHAGNDLAGNARGGQRLDLLAATAEDERVSAFQAHDAVPAARIADEHGVDLRLRERVVSGRLAGKDVTRARRFGEQARVHEAIVHDDVGGAQPREPAQRHEARIAGPRADKRDGSPHHDSRHAMRCSLA